MSSLSRVARATLAVFAALSMAAATAISGSDTQGSKGIGDPLLEKLGNGGYDVSHYDLVLDYHAKGNQLEGVATITATTTQDLSRFNLDFDDRLIATRVSVDGDRAHIRQNDEELIIRPLELVPAGAEFDIKVRYKGKPRARGKPFRINHIGWVRTDDGVWVANEPDAAHLWFPANDHPLDKATYRFEVTVPERLSVISNGELETKTHDGDRRTFIWNVSEPMASYLATVTMGPFKTATPTIAGIPSYIAWSRNTDFKLDRLVRVQRKVLQLYEDTFGPYPFSSTGAIVYGDVPEVPYVLETQSRPLYQQDPLLYHDPYLVVHEVAHQWFGNSVTLSRWDQTWLNEGFATWCEWLWLDHKGERTLHESFLRAYGKPPDHPAERAQWRVTPGAIDSRAGMFHGMVYERGAMTLQALKERIGSDPFFELLHDWVAENAYGNVTNEDFFDLAESISGQDLDHFFDVWLFEPKRPTEWAGKRAQRRSGVTNPYHPSGAVPRNTLAPEPLAGASHGVPPVENG